MNWRAGDRVLVSGPPGEVVAEILGVATPADMPVIDPPPDQVRAILQEWGVDLILLLSHRHGQSEVCFYALHYTMAGRQGWRDLHCQDLHVIPYCSPCGDVQ